MRNGLEQKGRHLKNNMRGLYAITDNVLIENNKFIATIEQALQGGAAVIQYRDKNTPFDDKVLQAHELLALCHQYHVPLIINDDVKLAKQIGADGVHLGKDDGTIAAAREFLGKHSIIGVSCYNQLNLAQQAVQSGANYIAFGRFFPSHTKPHAVLASPDLLIAAHQLFSCPIVAIGGITPENAEPLIAAGADCLAVVHGVFGQAQVNVAARNYAQLYSSIRI